MRKNSYEILKNDLVSIKVKSQNSQLNFQKYKEISNRKTNFQKLKSYDTYPIQNNRVKDAKSASFDDENT